MGRSDAELLEASRRGEREAYGALVERYQGAVCAVSYSRTGDRALSEDVAQETFITAWHQLGQLREVGRLRAWFCGIARNLARKASRRAKREAPHEHIVVFEGANPFDVTAAAESERVVRDALANVPATYRDALVLYYREQRSVREVAAALGISEPAALQRLARGRRYLADGVHDLVERSLRGGPARNLAAVVVASLPAILPSRADANPSSHGAHMFKIAALIGALAATGTTALLVHQHSAAAPAAVAAPSVQVAAAPAVAPVAAPIAHPQAAHAAPAPALPASAEAEATAPPLDRAAIQRLQLHRGPSRGPADAAVTIVVFDDLLCQYCGKAVGALDQLFDEYPGKLWLVVKHMPVHKAAVLPAEASLAAEAQGKFWALYDLMMAHQDDLSRDAVIELARQAGLDVAAFIAALDSHRFKAAVEADQAVAKQLDVTGTPTFYINGRPLVGAQPLSAFRAAVDEALADQ